MIGATVGSYQVREEIGEGGMGVVYAAEHPLIGRKVAVKVLLPEHSRNQEIVNRFFNEARAATLIRHPGLVEIFDFGYSPGRRGLHRDGVPRGREPRGAAQAAGRCRSRSWRRHRRARSPPPSARRTPRGSSTAISSPTTSSSSPTASLPGGERVKVLDFGIAKLSTHDSPGPNTPGGGMKTRTGVVMGTPLYMSPEQCRGAGQRRPAHRHLLARLHPVRDGVRAPAVRRGGRRRAHRRAHLEQPLPPREVEASVPRALQQVILKALAKKPDERQASMSALSAELEAAANAPVDDALDDDELLETPARAKLPRYVAAGAAALLLAVVGIALAVHQPAPAATSTPAATPAAAATSTPARTQAPARPPAEAKIELHVVSTPPGAEVFRAADGVLLGVTPFVESAAPSSGTALFLLKLAGYDDARAELPADRTGTATTTLVRTPVKVSRPTRTARPTAHKRVGDGAVDPF